MTFYPDGRDNGATIVSTSDKQGVTNPDYRTELERYWEHRELSRLMTQRTSVCG